MNDLNYYNENTTGQTVDSTGSSTTGKKGKNKPGKNGQNKPGNASVPKNATGKNGGNKPSINRTNLIIVCVVGLSCLAVVLGFLYSYYASSGSSLFGSSNGSTGNGMTGLEVADPDDSITNYVSPDTLLEWTEEAEDTLEEYVDEDADLEEDATASDEDSAADEESSSDSSSDSSSNNSSNSNSNSTTTTTPSETLGKGEWLAKYYDGGVMRYYGDGSVYDMTRNIWWTKTQWSEFMTSITQ